jgi:hypothetical protein
VDDEGVEVSCRLFSARSSVGIHMGSSPFCGPNGYLRLSPAPMCTSPSKDVGYRLVEKYYAMPHICSLSLYGQFLPEQNWRGEVEGATYGEGGGDFYFQERVTDYIRLPEYSPPAKRMYDYRKSKRMGITTAAYEDRHFEEIFDLYACEAARRGIPVKNREVVFQILNLKDSSRFQKFGSVALHNNTVVGALFTLAGPQTASYFLPVLDYRFKDHQIGVRLILDHVFHWKDLNKAYFNFESSPISNPAVRSFKRGFGTLEHRFGVFGFARQHVRIRIDSLMRELKNFYIYPN